MGDKSGIQWTDATWNPVTGCDKVSPGCANCYAEQVAVRFWPKQYGHVAVDDGTLATTRPRGFTDVWVHDDRLDQPLRWKRPRRIFVNSMSDLFHEAVPDTFILGVFSVMQRAPQHTFQVLTKRAERMLAITRWLGRKFADESEAYPLPNVWLGVSVENQHFADERIPLLLQAPAAVRFVSYEPALGPVDFAGRGWLSCVHPTGVGIPQNDHSACMPTLDWVIAGGESGLGARPSDLTWYRQALRQCKAAGVAFFMKQLGKQPYIGRGGGPEILTQSRPNADWYPEFYPLDIDRGHGGDMVEWPADLRVRELPR